MKFFMVDNVSYFEGTEIQFRMLKAYHYASCQQRDPHNLRDHLPEEIDDFVYRTSLLMDAMRKEGATLLGVIGAEQGQFDVARNRPRD